MVAYAAPAQKMSARVANCYQNAKAITPADATQIGPFSALWVGVAGDVTVVMRDDDGTTPVLFKAGVGLLPIAVQGVNATGTTATNIIGLG